MANSGPVVLVTGETSPRIQLILLDSGEEFVVLLS
jgi:hypothetical protein